MCNIAVISTQKQATHQLSCVYKVHSAFTPPAGHVLFQHQGICVLLLWLSALLYPACSKNYCCFC